LKISEFSIRRPVFTMVTMIFILILGTVSLLKTPLKLIPDISPPVGVVVATYPGAGPTEVVEKVTKPLEANLATLPGIKNIQSTSQEGSNFILMEFTWDTSIDDIQNEVLQRLDQTPLPDEVKPRFLKFDPSQFPIIQLSIRGEKNESSLRDLAEKLTVELSKVDGVASVTTSGTITEEIRVLIDQDQLKTYGLTQSDIVNVIQANQISLPGNTVLSQDKELTTRIVSLLHTVEDVENLIVTKNPVTGETIRLNDVANVELVSKEQETITRTNQQPSVLVNVLQQSDANTAEVSKQFQKKLDELLQEERFQSIKADLLFDQGEYIEQSIGNIGNALILGGAFSMIVLFFFLRSVKSPIIIGVAIPYSVVVTFVLMYFAKFSLNIMTLGGLALGIGMLVDNAIVVIENIYRHLSMGKDPKVAARDGAREVGGAITASTLTTVAVFLPVAFITGLIGELFSEFALTIAFSLLASLVVALTVVPMLASRWLKQLKGHEEARRRRSKPLKKLERSVRWALQHRFVVLFVTFALLVAGGYGISTVGMQFLPATDEGYFNIRVSLEDGVALSETEQVVKEVENVLKKESDIDVLVSLIGSTQEESFRGTSQNNIAEIYVKMKPLDERERSTFEFVDDVKEQLEKAAISGHPSAELSFNLQSTSGNAPQTLSFSVKDTNKKRLNESVEKIYEALVDLKDVNEITTDVMNKVDEVQITVDREKALNYGFVPAQVATTVNNITRGVQATQIVDEEGNVHGISVKYDDAFTKDVEALKAIELKAPSGEFVPLKEIASIEIGKGPVNIQRINQQDAVQFTLKYKSTTNLGEISRLVDKKIAALNLSPETEITFGGDRELLESSIDDMLLAMGLAIVLVYLVMSAQFESFKYPFIIMFTVPLMVIGVAIALTVTRTPVSISAIIGVIVLAGIVVNNAIVIVDYIQQRKAAGLDSLEAIVEAVQVRARPILMTALTTILGLLPLALGIGEGTEINQPMGITVIGGLISSTFLTLFIIPIVYSFFDKETRRMKKA
jgi:hydrophobic/amphiphilic exporter-1 (mainly G- bacteria), HAE1 family